jgi:transposase
MAPAHIPHALDEWLQPVLPPEEEGGPFGGHRRIKHRVVARVIWWVLVSACRRQDVPADRGYDRDSHREVLRQWGGNSPISMR